MPTADRRYNWPTPDRARTPAEAQTAWVLHEYGDYIEPGPPDWRSTESIRYFVRRNFVLVRDEYAARARAILNDAGFPTGPSPDSDPPPEEPRDGDVAYGLRYVQLNLADSGKTVFDALEILRTGRNEAGDRVAEPMSPDVVGLEHLVHLTDHTGGCPPTEVVFAPRGTLPDPPVTTDPCAGQGVRIVVIDTGWDERAAQLPWLEGVTGDPDPGINDGNIGRYAGHGTFIAGVIRTMAPAADVVVRAGLPGGVPGTDRCATNPPGTAFERELANTLERCLMQDSPDIISLSAGTLTEERSRLMLLDAFHDRVLQQHKGVVFLASAGNNGLRSRFWPAAGQWTVGVGALATRWRTRAQFSNFGAWVDVYAPGEHLINAFTEGLYTYTEPPFTGAQQRFDGMAVWSGTSFATPMVAGLIAARMSYTGETGPDAAAALLAQARRDAIPGVGPIMLPSDGSTGGGDRPGACTCRCEGCSRRH